MDLNRYSNNLAAETVRFLIQWMHRSEFLQKAALETKTCSLSSKTFAIFASFC